MNLIFENKKVKKQMESVIGRTGLLCFSPLLCYAITQRYAMSVIEIASAK